MATLQKSDFERDEITSAAIRERELNAALSYLDQAISRYATDTCPSRWTTSRLQSGRRNFPASPLTAVLRNCVTALKTEWRSLVEMQP